MSEHTISCWSCRGSGIHYATGDDCHICLHPSGLFSTGRVTVVPVSEKAKWQAEAWEQGAAAPRMQDGSELPAVDNPYREQA